MFGISFIFIAQNPCFSSFWNENCFLCKYFTISICSFCPAASCGRSQKIPLSCWQGTTRGLQKTCFGHGCYKALLCRTLRGGQAGQIGHTDCTAAQGCHVFCAHLRCVSFQVRRKKDSPCKCREAPQGRGKAGIVAVRIAVAGITPAGAGRSCAIWDKTVDFGDHPRKCGEKTI